MPAMTTDQLMRAALDLVGWEDVPADCAVYHPGTRIGHVLLGIDIEPDLVFMARQLGYHAVIAHRPCGYTGPIWEVAARHVDLLEAAGVPRQIAEEAVIPALNVLRVQALRENYDRAPSIARLIDQPFLSIQSPLDELARRAIQTALDAVVAAKPLALVGDLHDALMALPSFAAAKTEMLAPLHGWDVPAGRVAVVYGAHISPDAEIVKTYFAHGVDTVCCADMAPEDIALLTEEGIGGNILLMGRIATISAGILPFVAHLRGQDIEVTTCCGVVGI
ncbi:MAG TPA: hypothetical protein VKB76_01480 [Ktedonobacterales bacterium]|nr:hypothetical protein [Ktedonobacterales bacterium]